MKIGGNLHRAAETETVDPGMNGITDTKGYTDCPIGQTTDPLYPSTMVETTRILVHRAPLVGTATHEVESPTNPPVPTLRRRKASEYPRLARHPSHRPP